MAEAPGSGLLIIYRREDAAAARTVAERLRAEFGHHQVYLDETDLSAGAAWADERAHRLHQSRVVLVLIGPQWLGSRTTKAGRPLDDENDPVRRDVGTALQLGLHVMPVLLDGASFPRPEDLPPDLQPLAQRHAIELDARRFDADLSHLVEALRRVLSALELGDPGSWATAPAASAAVDEPIAAAAAEPPSRPSRRPELGTRPEVPLSRRWRAALTTSLAHTRRRVAQVLHPLGGEVLPAAPAWRAAYGLLLAGLLLWGVVWPYLWPALMPAPVAASDQALPAATGPVLPPGTRFRDCRDATCPWLRVLPAGTFTMGSPDDEPGRDPDEGPQHMVTVAKPFAVMETEVTVGLFKAFVDETRYPVEAGCFIWDGQQFKDDPDTNWRKPFQAIDQGEDHPVVCISWNTAQAFARWMTRRTGQPYRLLSEAEWEYAARSGSQAAYGFGSDPKQLCRFANVGDIRTRQGYPLWGKDWVNADCDDGHVYTAPVGSFQPNAFGLYDMHGNAWEWVQDCRNDYTAEPRTADAIERTNCAQRLLRGGGWFSDPRYVRSAFRYHYVPTDRDSHIGFRLARMLP